MFVGTNDEILGELKLNTVSVDLRDDFIARVVRGRTFADVGGLWGITSEKISVASRAQASALAMIDVQPAGTDLWRQFRERLRSLNVDGCECISSDVCDIVSTGDSPTYDVVHCSGVLYHHPNPISLLDALRRITGQYLILTSAVTQEHISNELGSYDVPPSGVIFVPALSSKERAILWKYWQESSGAASCYGISEPVQWNLRDFAPWWWLPTPHAMLALAQCVGFQVVDSGPTWYGNAHTALLKAVG